MSLLSKDIFLKKYKINEKAFIKSGMDWSNLEAVYQDYYNWIGDLELTAQPIVNKLNKAPNVNSVKYRIKDPEHLIEKIIRKKLEDNEDIGLDNYQEKITDIIGIRVLYLFKEDWKEINNYVIKEFKLIKKPIAYVRNGDIEKHVECFKENNCEIMEHPFGYRSVHYIFESSIFKKKFIIELQVRTIFEEGWSEVDHKIKYPYLKNDLILEKFLDILNRFAGSADEMCSFINYLQYELENREQKIINLESKIDQLKIGSSEKFIIKKDIQGFNKLFSGKSNLTLGIHNLGVNTQDISERFNNVFTGNSLNVPTSISELWRKEESVSPPLFLNQKKCEKCGKAYDGGFTIGDYGGSFSIGPNICPECKNK